jgi:hypothetical protein
MHKHHAPTPLPSSTMCPSELVSMGRHPHLLLRLPSHSLGSLPRSTRCRSPPTPWPPWKLRPLQPPLAHTCGQAAVGHLGLSQAAPRVLKGPWVLHRLPVPRRPSSLAEKQQAQSPPLFQSRRGLVLKFEKRRGPKCELLDSYE